MHCASMIYSKFRAVRLDLIISIIACGILQFALCIARFGVILHYILHRIASWVFITAGMFYSRPFRGKPLKSVCHYSRLYPPSHLAAVVTCSPGISSNNGSQPTVYLLCGGLSSKHTNAHYKTPALNPWIKINGSLPSERRFSLSPS